ncbi:mitochondrial inner membrane protein-domain-containing protein [Pilobolus umbonatus]|nr:mitochondrial inner membrane protein-domain-containing protein [Pilobolus umbonatus]
MLKGANAVRSTIRLTNSVLTPQRFYTTVEESTKKSGSIGKKLLGLTLLTASVYSGATYFALTNEAFHDTYTTYVPGGDKLLDILEDWAEDDRIKSYYKQSVELKNKVANQTESAKKVATEVQDTALDWYEYILDSIAQLKGEKEAPAVPGSGPSPTIGRTMKRPQKKQALFSNVIHSTEPQPLPEFPQSEESVINEFGKTITDLVKVLNEAGMSGHAKRLVDFATRDMEQLEKAFKQIKSDESQSLQEVKDLDQSLALIETHYEKHQKNVQELKEKMETEYAARIRESSKNVEADIAKDTKELGRQLQGIYAKELSSQRKHYANELQKELKAKAVQIQADYVKQVQHQVETERGGRLSQIDAVTAKGKQFETLAQNDAELLDDVRKAHKMIVAIDSLTKAALQGDQNEFKLELDALKKLTQKSPFSSIGERQTNELIQVVINTVQDHVAKHGIVSINQLSDRFETVAREVRRAALIPEEDASMISHLMSIILTSFMFHKKGLVAGDDIESRVARAEYYLNIEKDLESATREINQLTGWPKRLSMDWLEAARRHLEVKQAIEILRSQSSVISMLQTK